MLKYYFGRIQLLMSRIATLISELHPTNRPIADYFVTDWTSTYVTDGFLAGVHKAVQNVDQDDELFGRFKEYVLEEEAKMKEKLQTVMYCIDATNTLDLVINSSRLETVCTVVTNEIRQLKIFQTLMPLIYLLLLRAMHVLRQGRKVPLHAKELTNITQSFRTIWSATSDRVNDLNGRCWM